MDIVERKKTEIERKLKTDPYNGYLWLDYGDILLDEYDEPLATVTAYKNAQKYLPDKDMRLKIGVALNRAGKSSEGIKIIKESLKENPRANGYCILADIYISNSMNDLAILECDKALQIDPNYEEAFYLKGESLKFDCPQKSIKYYKKAISIDNEYQLSWFALGREMIATEEGLEEGIKALMRAIELDPHDGWAQIFLANAYWKIGNIILAEKWYKLAIKTYPDFDVFQKMYNQFLKKC